jgi:hypothetical protein
VALAVVFGVSPSRLLLPETGSDELIALTPRHTTTERAAWAWATGDHPLPDQAGGPQGQGPNAGGDARTGSFSLSGGGGMDVTGLALAADFQTVNRPHAPRDTWTLDDINAHLHSLDQLAHAVRGALADGGPTATIHRWVDYVGLTRPVEGTTDKENADHGAR